MGDPDAYLFACTVLPLNEIDYIWKFKWSRTCSLWTTLWRYFRPRRFSDLRRRRRNPFWTTQLKFTPRWLFQLCVLQLSSDENGDVGVSVFPEREEILIGGLGFRHVAFHRVGSADLQMRECADGFVNYDPAMLQDFLEFGGGFAALMRGPICFPAHVDGILGGRELAPPGIPIS